MDENTSTCESEHDQEANNGSKVSHKHMTSDKRRIIFDYLLRNSKNMVVNKGFKMVAAYKFSVSTRTIVRIWAHGKKNMENGIDFSNKSVGNAGRKRIHVDITNKVKAVPFSKRTNIRTLANAIQVSKSTLHRRV